MDLWEKIQKDIKTNIKEGLSIVKEGSAIVSQRIEKLTEEGKKRYQVFTLNMRVRDEFSRLGGKIYGLSGKTRNPMTNRNVAAIVSRIKKLEDRIKILEQKPKKRKAKPFRKKAKKAKRGSLRA
ncbi:MAG TPA: hypothetical protein ENH45_02780 [Nitrospirae bacterium]|nr:hypothetical protein BMS3Abin10_01777 [bacterium BMS3Abin10]GBE39078.1 hypothetical protein BMS3Bbin08_01696 [bacterium BMS3Bbin08]HDK41124.1 hypothetical protein [Nitrospirota bacterium]HDZ84119.1 hypothetical protein [Nitrospirota bacterium]